MPRPTITGRQRAAIYEPIRQHLAGLDDVRKLMGDEPEKAAREALQFGDADGSS